MNANSAAAKSTNTQLLQLAAGNFGLPSAGAIPLSGAISPKVFVLYWGCTYSVYHKPGLLNHFNTYLRIELHTVESPLTFQTML